MTGLRWPARIDCHDRDPAAHRTLPAWRPRPGRGNRPACTFCLSAQPAAVYELLRHVPPSDPPWLRGLPFGHPECGRWAGMWLHGLTNGWPRRFHLLVNGEHLIFDARHLYDLGDAEFTAVTAVIAAHTGTRFGWAGDGRLTYTGTPTGGAPP